MCKIRKKEKTNLKKSTFTKVRMSDERKKTCVLSKDERNNR